MLPSIMSQHLKIEHHSVKLFKTIAQFTKYALNRISFEDWNTINTAQGIFALKTAIGSLRSYECDAEDNVDYMVT